MTTQLDREQLKSRIEKALKDFTEGRASMHVPPSVTDVEMLLSECRDLLAVMDSDKVYGPYTPKFVGAGVWATITEELPSELEGKQVWLTIAPPAPASKRVRYEVNVGGNKWVQCSIQAYERAKSKGKITRELYVHQAPVAGPDESRVITHHFDTIALEAAREIMCDVNRRADFPGDDIQLLSHIQCRIGDACRAAMLKAGHVTGWIKCSERTPEVGDEYYLTHSNAGVDVSYFCGGSFSDEHATHWMPLPAAPEQEV